MMKPFIDHEHIEAKIEVLVSVRDARKIMG
jgi:hypothetical protein